MPGKAAKIIVTERQLATLKTMTASSTCPQGVAQRARMIILAFEGETNECIAEQVRCERHMVGVWRRRWARAFERLASLECGEALRIAADDRTVLERFAARRLAGKILRRTGGSDHRGGL